MQSNRYLRFAFCLAAGLLVFSGCEEKPYTGPALPEGYSPYQPRQKQPNPVVAVKTSLGDLTMELYEDDAPNTVNNFVNLAEIGFYDGVKFHRIAKMGGKDTIIQTGDPKGDGSGGPGYRIPDEYKDNPRKHDPYAVAMARESRPDSAGSQFYFCGKDGAHGIDGQYTVFGKVTSGTDVVDKIAAVPVDGEKPKEEVKILSIKVVSKRSHEYAPWRKLPDSRAKRQETKKEEPKKDEPKKDEPKKDEPKKDEAKKDESKKDEAKKDESKKEEPKKEEKKDEKKADDKAPAGEKK
jgi:peptidyl-prolyl cis-trans isomerase B (cyclophilin B)